jgi:hypothetical protein
MSKAFVRLKQSEILRQQALDYIIANPGASGPDVVQHFGWNESSGSSRLLCMKEEGELRREKVDNVFRYYALVEKTKRAEDVFSTLGANLTSAGREEHRRSKPETENKWVNGCWKNNPESKEMYTNQGGQGASKPRMATYLEVMA